MERVTVDDMVAEAEPYVRWGVWDRINRHDDDMAQEVRIAVLLAARQFDPSRGVPWVPYCRMKIRQATATYLRQHGPKTRRGVRRAPVMSFDDPDVLVEARVESGVGALIDMLDCLEVLRKLPARTREILVRVAAGESQKDVADDLGLTEARVSQIMRKVADRGRRRRLPST